MLLFSSLISCLYLIYRTAFHICHLDPSYDWSTLQTIVYLSILWLRILTLYVSLTTDLLTCSGCISPPAPSVRENAIWAVIFYWAFVWIADNRDHVSICAGYV